MIPRRALPLTLLVLGACAPGAARPGTPPVHLLLVTVDTLRADHLSGFLYPRDTSRVEATPDERARGSALAIDDLIEQGVAFPHAFAPRGMTFPSIATLFTGRSPLEHCALSNGDPLPEREQTLAECFRAAGFQTAGFTANRLLVAESGIAQGFEHFDSTPALAEDQDVALVQRAFHWLRSEQARDGRPLFVWLHFMGPHLPYEPRPFGGVDYARVFTDPDYAGSADGSRERLDAAYAAGASLTPQDVHQVVALYDGEVARTNQLLLVLLRFLAGLLDEADPDRLRDTAVCFAADHGEELYQRHGYWAHSKSVYDSVLRVPLVLRHPASLTGGRLFDDVVELQDLAPTLLEWFALPVPASVRGRSLFRLVDEHDRRGFESRPAFGSWGERIFTVRTARWRYVHNPLGIEPDDPPEGRYPIPREALYDVVADPLELEDVAPAHPEVVGELRSALAAWLGALPACDGRGTGVSDDYRRALHDLGYAAHEPELDHPLPGDTPGGSR